MLGDGPDITARMKHATPPFGIGTEANGNIVLTMAPGTAFRATVTVDVPKTGPLKALLRTVSETGTFLRSTQEASRSRNLALFPDSWAYKTLPS